MREMTKKYKYVQATLGESSTEQKTGVEELGLVLTQMVALRPLMWGIIFFFDILYSN